MDKYNYNPFRENRAEQMKDLWKYYVPCPGISEAAKPLIVEGGRGTGKTMLFQCNSWRQKLLEIKKNDKSYETIFNDSFLGIYYRVDTTFVSSMINRDETKWDAIFETYFSICILKEILDLIKDLSEKLDIDIEKLKSFIGTFSSRLYNKNAVETLDDFLIDVSRFLDFIEDKINGEESVNSDKNFRYIKAQRFIMDLCEGVNILFDKEILFKIFIDEYETLEEYQQKIINTFIKHSTRPVIFNIGLRPKGMKTTATISSTEILETPHDYEQISLKIDQDKYFDLLKEICKKRIELAKSFGKIDTDVSSSIEFYLGNYSIDDEVEFLQSTSKKPPHISRLKEKIIEICKKENISVEKQDEYIEVLCQNAPILNSRLHYALFCKSTNYTPKIDEVYKGYIEKNKRYMEWMHSRKFGLVFLLAKELKKEKLYYGFDVFAILSSNVIRYFLELCEQAFKFAFLDNYNWKEPISKMIQTDAAKHVSEYKIMDISSYNPYGHDLRIFIQYLGEIFYRLHTNTESTLGEPEPNHFNTNDLSLPGDIKNKISSAIMWNVLYVNKPTKRKHSVASAETVDYYINKIYTPYFGISYRNQRKIQIDISVLDQLFSGKVSDAVNGKNEQLKSLKTNSVQNLEKTLFDID